MLRTDLRDPLSRDASAIERASPTVPRLERAEGRLVLEVGLRDGRSALLVHRESGCAKARFPQPARPGVLEAVLLNTAGGITGGDRIHQELRVREGAALLAAGQAAEKIYRSTGADAEVVTRLEVSRASALFWLPQETILFDGARLVRELAVELSRDARLLLVEAVVLGRTARGEEVLRGRLVDRRVLRVGGVPLFVDPLRLEGPIAELARRPALLDGARAFATLLALGPAVDEHVCAALRDRLPDGPARAACGLRGPLLLCRVLAADGLALRRALLPALAFLLPLLGGPPELPRIWRC
ncbi:MAG: urease accessory protein UreD [Geminicoccaceae bacterium]|nr:urease accessory protein UreD [Geminicoccaceae bacterium]MCS7268332.1 urease accessory protein UreD [Geminicoccaceae bacterium]MCX7629218.1 urease accessory protein UreD [Geminicoccaceae bacterium]MDW8124617.1 urease accessory protein UreD [Geminicoccaceae bacterium]MDW8341303.1 urease accessory protein UreD [Geminicoccaceae bacterium]